VITEQHRKLLEHALEVVEHTDEWKHHGFGILQVTVTPAHRLNLWAPELRTIGRDAGAWHTHRARIHATVIAGAVFNTPVQIERPRIDRSPACVPVEVWEVPHRGNGEMRRSHAATVVVGPRSRIDAGRSYVVERGAGHWAEPGPNGAVTSALMMDMGDTTASVFVPRGMSPAPAFGARGEFGAGVVKVVRERAAGMLRAVLEGCAAP
jgi:hypothetical protein